VLGGSPFTPSQAWEPGARPALSLARVPVATTARLHAMTIDVFGVLNGWHTAGQPATGAGGAMPPIPSMLAGRRLGPGAGFCRL
jgi:hypothetical protein